jgi:hypothetical protein
MPCRQTSVTRPRTLRALARKARHRGGLSFGYFSLATQRKVTRRPVGRRKPAAGEPDHCHATIVHVHAITWMTSFAVVKRLLPTQE